MIFLGDIACPEKKVDAFVKSVKACKIFKNELVILNLEATFSFDDNCQDYNDECLFNSKKVLDGFLDSEKVIVSLANNHMYDYPERILPTKKYLESLGIGTFGLCDENGLVLPYEYKTLKGEKLAFFGHCWRLYTKTNTNKVNDIRVVDHEYGSFIKIVTQYIEQNQDTKVYCFMHWNYDLEKLPFPLHLNVARTLIDNGAYGVIGSHSHRPQAAEIYKGKIIVYGLGNFYLPSNVYFSGKLKYPEYSKDTYALVCNDNNIEFQWFKTDDEKQDAPIVLACREDIMGEKISTLSEGIHLEISQYISYFRKNRVKKLLVPVFIDYKGMGSKFKESFAILRVKLLRYVK